MENVWGSMKQALQADYKPKNLPELEAAVEHYWRTKLTQRVCERYVGHISRVLPVVVEVDGEPNRVLNILKIYYTSILHIYILYIYFTHL